MSNCILPSGKKCNTCKVYKSFDNFSINKAAKDQLNNRCKACHSDYCIKYYQEKRDYFIQKAADRRRADPQKDREIRSRSYHKNIEKRKSTSYNYYEKNREKKLEYEKKYRELNKEARGERERQYYAVRKNDAHYKLRGVLRSRLNQAVKNNQKTGSAVRDLGCSIAELKAYLESRFQPGMTWENRSLHGWHIDNVLPLDSFDLSDREQLLKACHYTNLQPLWAKDNLRKGAKLEAEANKPKKI